MLVSRLFEGLGESWTWDFHGHCGDQYFSRCRSPIEPGSYSVRGVVNVAPPRGDRAPGDRPAAGDFDGDGFEDMAVGASGEDITYLTLPQFDAGAVNVLYGTASGLSAVDNQFWHQGLLVPAKGEVGWQANGRLEIVWRGDITSLEYEFGTAG